MDFIYSIKNQIGISSEILTLSGSHFEHNIPICDNPLWYLTHAEY